MREVLWMLGVTTGLASGLFLLAVGLTLLFGGPTCGGARC